MVSERWMPGATQSVRDMAEGSAKLKNKAEVRETEAKANEVKVNKKVVQEENHMLNARREEHRGGKENVWLIDSGCTSHMTPYEKLFIRLNTNIKVPIQVGNGAVLMSKGKGVIEVKTKKGTRIIRDVFLVPSLGKNLLSVPHMVMNGYEVNFKKQSCIIHDSRGRKIGEIQMENKSFHLKWPTKDECAMVAKTDVAELWHQRLGHTCYSNLNKMQSKRMVFGLPKFRTNAKRCESCILSKHSRDVFPRESWSRAKGRLELIHSDVCGPMQNASMSGSRYVLTFIDDATRMIWVYFLKAKSEVFGIFKRFKQLVENQSGCKIKKLRTDRGTEYLSGEFTRFLEDNGIERQLTAAYSPQQNGVAERRNRSLIEMARAMIKAKDLPLSFWAEAVYNAAYIQNRTTTRTLENKTPLEAWNKTRPSVNHMRVDAYAMCMYQIRRERSGMTSQKEPYLLVIVQRQKVTESTC